MSRMLCKCGATIGTSVSPSPYNMYIYYEHEVQSAIAENPRILLSDFLTDWDELAGNQKDFMKRSEAVEYWHCPQCKRIYETQVQIGGHWLRVYQHSAHSSQNISLEGWSRIYVFEEIETDRAIEESPLMLLSNYLEMHEDVQYFLALDEKTVVAVTPVDHKVQFTYILEG